MTTTSPALAAHRRYDLCDQTWLLLEPLLPGRRGVWGGIAFYRWRDTGVWAQLLEALVSEPDFEWLMIDATHIKVHPHAAGTRGGNQAMGLTKGG